MATITNTAIANIALKELGAAKITSFTDGSKNQGLVVDFWDFAKEYALSYYPWTFSIKRQANLATLATAPAWGWKYAYAYPSDCLRILVLGKGGVETDMAWAHEAAADGSQIIVTDIAAPIDVKYIYNVTNTQVFSPQFVIALAKTLKWMLAIPITGKIERQIQAEKELQEYFARGMSVNGQEGTPVQYGSSILEDVR